MYEGVDNAGGKFGVDHGAAAGLDPGSLLGGGPPVVLDPDKLGSDRPGGGGNCANAGAASNSPHTTAIAARIGDKGARPTFGIEE